MADSDLARYLHEVEIAVKDKKIDLDSYTCTRIFAELKYPGEVVKTTIKGNLLKSSQCFYKETRDEGVSTGRESGVRSVPASAVWFGFRPPMRGGTPELWKEMGLSSMT